MWPSDIERKLTAIQTTLADHHRHLLNILTNQQTILTNQEKIMSKISDFAAAQNAFNDRMDTAITDLQGDVKSLNDKIAELQNSAGQVTPEDQKLLDDLQARGAAIADKLDALDAQTPPVVPSTP